MSFEVFAIGLAILIWLVSSAVKGLRRLAAQLRGKSARPGPAGQASPIQQAGPGASQALPQRVPPLARQPPPSLPVSAPVRYKTSAAAFVSQEEALQAEEASGLGVPLTSAAAPRAPQAAPLFGSTDDLVRAVILQEVLGPPLSRRPPPA